MLDMTEENRVAHRMAIDYNSVIKVIFLDIIPTNSFFELTSRRS